MCGKRHRNRLYHIDTAASYLHEEAVGSGIMRSGIGRKNLFLTTKLWMQKNGFAGTLKAFDNSLNRLRVEYVDFYLIHQPFGNVYGEWRATEQFYRQGKIRAISVAHFQPDLFI